MTDKPPQDRDRRTGRYTFDGEMDRPCVCGHNLGVHTGDAPHVCIVGDFEDTTCDCRRFRPSRKSSTSKQG